MLCMIVFKNFACLNQYVFVLIRFVLFQMFKKNNFCMFQKKQQYLKIFSPKAKLLMNRFTTNTMIFTQVGLLSKPTSLKWSCFQKHCSSEAAFKINFTQEKLFSKGLWKTASLEWSCFRPDSHPIDGRPKCITKNFFHQLGTRFEFGSQLLHFFSPHHQCRVLLSWLTPGFSHRIPLAVGSRTRQLGKSCTELRIAFYAMFA